MASKPSVAAGAAAAAAVDDADPIVKEMDVVVSRQLHGLLYLLQFPLRPRTRPLSQEDDDEMSARFKADLAELQLALPISTDHHHDRARSKEMATQANNAETNAQKEATFEGSTKPYPSNHVDTVRLQSSSYSSPRYAIGTIKDGRLHLTALKSVLQMRPALTHLDLAHTPQQQGNTSDGEDNAAGEQPESVVRQQVRKVETARQQQRRLQSYQYHLQQRNLVPWKSLSYHGQNSDEADARKAKLATETTVPLNFAMPARTYMDNLSPVADEYHKPYGPQHHITAKRERPLFNIATLPTKAAVRNLLAQAQVVTHQDVLRSIPANEKLILKHLQTSAVLIQGCWVARSELVFPPKSTSRLTSSPAAALCKTRDLLLWHFRHARLIRRDAICALTKLNVRDVTSMLEQLAIKSKAQRGWVFKLPRNAEFLDSNEPIVKEQDEAWQTFESSMFESLALTEEQRKELLATEAVVAQGDDSIPPVESLPVKLARSDRRSSAKTSKSSSTGKAQPKVPKKPQPDQSSASTPQADESPASNAATNSAEKGSTDGATKAGSQSKRRKKAAPKVANTRKSSA